MAPIGGPRSGIIGGGAGGIPDSAVSQFKVDEGSGTTLTNEFTGQPDATVNGASWVSASNLVGGSGLSFDGTDDSVTIDSLYSFIDLSTPFSFCVTVDMTDLSTDQVIWHTGLGAGNGAFAVGTPVTNSGSLGAEIRNTDNNTAASERTASVDTNRLRFGVGFDPTTPSITLAVNGSTVTTNADDNVRASPSANNNVLGMQASSFYAGIDELDNPIWYDKVLSGFEFGDDYNAQPWS